MQSVAGVTWAWEHFVVIVGRASVKLVLLSVSVHETLKTFFPELLIICVIPWRQEGAGCKAPVEGSVKFS